MSLRGCGGLKERPRRTRQLCTAHTHTAPASAGAKKRKILLDPSSFSLTKEINLATHPFPFLLPLIWQARVARNLHWGMQNLTSECRCGPAGGISPGRNSLAYCLGTRVGPLAVLDPRGLVEGLGTFARMKWPVFHTSLAHSPGQSLAMLAWTAGSCGNSWP